eukprot:TRINITY_DN24064_c0_g1_i1.p1 TRINITY_DN24064_c0_g1~~TRINITY_DN24064_c0_g1_i1.p1  ORF type:complete len:309 (-),score=17.10 TRINITY_DN24064_c0_g1_i1:7-855(-)
MKYSNSYGLAVHGSETCGRNFDKYWNETRAKYKTEGKPFRELDFVYASFYGNVWSKFRYNDNGWHPTGATDSGDKANSVLWMPLGTAWLFPRISPKWITSSSNRTVWCSFAGSVDRGNRMLLNGVLHALAVKYPRHDFIRKSFFSFLYEKNITSDTYITKQAVGPKWSAQLMLNSVFCLAPGGQHIESYRLYEALDTGCIPIVEVPRGVIHGKKFWCKDGLEPFWRLGEPPWVWVDDFTKIPKIVTSMMKEPHQVNILQRKIMNWWQELKAQYMVMMSESTN